MKDKGPKATIKIFGRFWSFFDITCFVERVDPDAGFQMFIGLDLSRGKTSFCYSSEMRLRYYNRCCKIGSYNKYIFSVPTQVYSSESTK